MSMNENDILQRIVKVEVTLNALVGEIRELRENHFFHLTKQLDKLNEKVSGSPSWAVSLVIAGLVGLVSLLVPLVLQK